MRKIVLSPHDLEMFAANLTGIELEFIEKHWKPFRQMWTEQGRKFWIQFLTVYRISATEYGVIKDLLIMRDGFQPLIDELFILIHENFIDGSFSSAKKLIDDIITLVINKDKFKFLQSKSFAKDPFYNKETRDSFRHLFGSPKHNKSYIKVCALHEIYTVFGGAVMMCLKRWLVAEELPPGAEDSWQPMILTGQQKQESSFNRLPFCCYCHQKDDGTIPVTRYSGREAFMMEKMDGQPCGPWFVAGWKRHEDPRFHDPKNPLYNLMENPESDWRDTLDLNKFLEFHRYVNKNYPVSDPKVENACEHPEFCEDVMDILKTGDKVRIRVVNKSAQDDVHLSAASTGGRNTDTGMEQKSKKEGNMKTGAKVDMDLILSSDIEIKEHQHVLTSDSRTVYTQSTVKITSLKEVYEDKPETEEYNHDTGLAESLSFEELSLDEDTEKLSENDEAGDIFAVLRKLRQPVDNFSDTKIKDQANSDDNPISKWKSKKCSQCEQWELLPKTFKMCQMCKELHLKSARYYCSRDCQLKDWKARHKLEHKHNLLK